MIVVLSFRFLFVEDWTSKFIQAAQAELTSMVSDWKYDYRTNDRECSTMLLWMAVRLNPVLAAKFDLQLPDLCDENGFDEFTNV